MMTSGLMGWAAQSGSKRKGSPVPVFCQGKATLGAGSIFGGPGTGIVFWPGNKKRGPKPPFPLATADAVWIGFGTG
jgi:hypothetical protein